MATKSWPQSNDYGHGSYRTFSVRCSWEAKFNIRLKHDTGILLRTPTDIPLVVDAFSFPFKRIRKTVIRKRCIDTSRERLSAWTGKREIPISSFKTMVLCGQ